MLFNLLAVPPSVRVDPCLAPLTRLWCGDVAQQYACAVLQGAGGLVRGLGAQLLGDLAALPRVRDSFPALHTAAADALRHLAATQLHTGGGERGLPGWPAAAWLPPAACPQAPSAARLQQLSPAAAASRCRLPCPCVQTRRTGGCAPPAAS